MNLLPVSDEAVARAAAALANGEVVVYPAETMYGLGVDPFSEAAIQRLFEVKGRPETNPIPVVVASEEQLAELVQEIPSNARKLIDTFWPGPLSLVLPKSAAVPGLLTAGRTGICVRCPGSAVARALCTRFGRGITSTSANRSGEPPVRSLDDFPLDGVAIGIDAGRLAPGPPSTIYDVIAETVVREGPIDLQAIVSALAE